jgi:hypothetical protein
LKPNEFLREFLTPLTSASVLFALILFYALFEIASLGREPEPLNVELLSWVGKVWTLFPIVHVGAFTYAVYFVGSYFGAATALAVALTYAFFLPAGVDEETERERHLVSRTAVLKHAYGIISRGNRDKGLEHIYDALAEDPYEEAGWASFLR